MSKRNAIQQAFDQFGKTAGMEKKSGSWYRRSDEVIAVSNLQKSNYGPQYYFNQAFWLTRLGDETAPKEWTCPVRARLGFDLLRDERERVDQLLDLEFAMSDEDRIEELVGLLVEWVLPVIERATTLAGLRELRDEGVVPARTFTRYAMEALDSIS